MLAALGIFGASLFFGDSMITPAISVLSAVEGVKVVDAVAGRPRHPDHAWRSSSSCSWSSGSGTGAVGRLFGPVMVVWFAVLGVLGVRGIADHPEILQGAVADLRASASWSTTSTTAFFALAAVVLAVTGAEALYADMGHFGRPPIRRAWFAARLPGLHPELHGPGRPDPGQPEQHQQPVLPAGPGLGPAPDGLPRRRGDGHRLAGRHHRRLLGRPPGRPARLPAAAAHPVTPRKRRSARSTSRASTGCCWSRCSRSCSRSGARPRWPTPTARP